MKNRVTLDHLIYRLAEKKDEAVINSILRQNSMDSWISISTEHEPSYFDSADLFGHRETIIGMQEMDERVVGMGSYTLLPVHINGEACNVGYIGELRICEEFRHRFRILRNAYEALRLFSSNQAAIEHWYTSIASENKKARRLLEAKLKDKPHYQPQGEMLSLALSTSGNYSNVMQNAKPEDIPAIVHFYNRHSSLMQYSPVLTEEWMQELCSAESQTGLSLNDFWLLTNGKNIVACFALWDQRKFKQSVVRGYRFPLNISRPFYNLFSRLNGHVVLPPKGKPINYIFIAFLAIDKKTLTDGQAIIESALTLARNKNAAIAMLGLSVKNSLVDRLKPYPKAIYRTVIESVQWANQADVTVALDERMVQPEIAIL